MSQSLGQTLGQTKGSGALAGEYFRTPATAVIPSFATSSTVTLITSCPVPLRTPVVKGKTKHELGDLTRTVVRLVEKFDLVHLLLGILAPKMAVVLDHLRIRVAEPFPNLSF